MSREIIEYLKLFHGAYNTVIMAVIVYQGTLGLRIRRSESLPSHIIKRHRKNGPFIVVLGITGFIAGMTIAFLDHGRILKYPLHFINGLIIVSLLLTTYFISRRIKGPEKFWRNRHYAVGIVIVLLYFVQLFLGLGVLL
jgi:cytochrome bd-type quinol oxidase subunit 2